MSEKTFLVEIGTEELPSKSLRKIAESFAKNFTIELDNANLSYDHIQWFATPRRLALKVVNLANSQPDRIIEKRGPSIDQAFDKKGKPSKAAEEWARYLGISINQAERLTSDTNEWLLYRVRKKGKNAKSLIPNMVITSLKKLSVQKLMRWGTSNIHFIRPVHTLTLLLGDQVIPATIFGIKSNRIIRGHRFMGEIEFTINNAEHYPKILLERGKVIADYEQRKSKIKSDAMEIANKIGGNVELSDILVEEITAMVEWPVVLAAKFEEKFLSIPTEALLHTMKNNQKYFPIYTADGQLLPNFIFVCNIESKDPNQIIFGNEMVIRARLSDAEFFFKTDRKRRLEDYLPHLECVLFQQKLGTLREKTNRIQKLSGLIAEQIGANVDHAVRAALLSKCDLTTSMVCEFTDIQGVIGMHYARYDGESEDVAIALNEQYYPRFSGDKLPSSLVSCAVGIADRIDTLVGIFGIGQHPKGKKDPFALRRTALSVLRIIVEKKLNLDLKIIIKEAVLLYNERLTNSNVVNDVINFMLKRFRSWYQDAGYSIDTIQAVLANKPTCPLDFDARIKAISYFRTLKAGEVLTSVNKRIANILSKSNEKLNNTVHTSILIEVEEINLFKKIFLLHKKLKPYLKKGRYQDALIELTTLSKLVDEFFEKVMVNVDNKNVRINRLTLLAKLRDLFLQIADISLLR